MNPEEVRDELLYLRYLAEDLGLHQTAPTCLYVDNKGALEIAKNPVSSTSMKHVLRRHFFLREAESDSVVQVHPIPSSDNLADVLTKVVDGPRLSEMLSRIRKRFL